MLDFKMLDNIDKVVNSAERIATALEQSTVALNKLTAMNEKCMKLIDASIHWADDVAVKFADPEDEGYVAFKSALDEVKKVWNQPGFSEACNTMIKAGI